MTKDDDLPSLPDGALEDLANDAPEQLPDSYEEGTTMTVTFLQIHVNDNHQAGPWSINEYEHDLYAFTGTDHYEIKSFQGLASRLLMKDIQMLQWQEPMVEDDSEPKPAWKRDAEPEGTISIYADSITSIEEYSMEIET